MYTKPNSEGNIKNETDEARGAYGGEDKRTEGFGEETRSKEATWTTTRGWKNMIKRDLKEIKSES